MKIASGAIYELRENYAHAFHDVGLNEVWLFHFGPSPSDQFDKMLVTGGFSGRRGPSRSTFHTH